MIKEKLASTVYHNVSILREHVNKMFECIHFQDEQGADKYLESIKEKVNELSNTLNKEKHGMAITTKPDNINGNARHK